MPVYAKFCTKVGLSLSPATEDYSTRVISNTGMTRERRNQPRTTCTFALFILNWDKPCASARAVKPHHWPRNERVCQPDTPSVTLWCIHIQYGQHRSYARVRKHMLSQILTQSKVHVQVVGAREALKDFLALGPWRLLISSCGSSGRVQCRYTEDLRSCYMRKRSLTVHLFHNGLESSASRFQETLGIQ